MDDKFDLDLADAMLYNGAARRLLSDIKVNVNGGGLTEFCLEANDELFFYSKLNNAGDSDDDGGLFGYIEYLTLIPGGEEGYRLFDRYIREVEGVSAAEWRYNTFVKILGRDLPLYGSLQLDRIRRYFKNRELREVHWDNMDEVATGLFRARHNAETCLKRGDAFEFDEVWKETFDTLTELLPEKKVMTMAEILSCAPAPQPLTEREKEFVKSAKERIESNL